MKRIEMESAAIVAQAIEPESGSGGRTGSFLNYVRFRTVATKLTVIYSDLKGLRRVNFGPSRNGQLHLARC